MRRFLFAAAIGVLVLAGCSQHAPSPPPSPPPPPGSISYDSQCYTIDGKDTFIFSGSFHYFRCPKPLWADRFEKMKAAGLNCVETYVAWNWHERQPPASVDDFSQMDMTDLADWLDMAINRFGFDVIIRPGPYICAEWDGGGYPQWLVTKKPADAKTPWFRSDDPAYLAWCRHWYAACAKTVAPWQLTHRPAGQHGVILWQIENEYDYAQVPVEQKLHQLQALGHDARDFGIDVPLITCMTLNPLFQQDPFLHQNVIECSNTYPGFAPAGEVRNLSRLDTYQTDRPRLVTELQGGWFSDYGVGKQLSGDMGYTPAQITHVTLLAWALGYTGTNYYMMFGGTNLGDWGAASRTTSYDYAAPIREWGGVGPRYFAVAAMGKMIQQQASELVRTVAEPLTLNPPAPDDLAVLMRRAADGSRYLFVLNNRRDEPAEGNLHLATPDPNAVKMDVRYDLGPFDAKVLYLPAGVTEPSQGQWLPEPVAPPQRPTQVPAAVDITQARRQIDPGPVEGSWRPLPPSGGVEDAGIFDRRYVFYRTALNDVSPSARLTLFGELPQWAGSLLAQFNGTQLTIQGHGIDTVGAKLPALTSGDNQLLVLYENGGRANGGNDMERKCGPADFSVANGGFLPHSLTYWRMRATEGDPAPLTAPKVNDSSWDTVRVGGQPNQVPRQTTAVLRAHLDLSDDQIKAGAGTLIFGEISANSRVYVNGQAVEESHPQTFDATSALKPGGNVVAVVISTVRRPGGIGHGAQLVSSMPIPTVPVQWQVSGQTAGTAGQWWQTALNDSSWPSVSIGAPVDKTDPPALALVWYRLHFALPAPDPQVWVPWKLHLAAAGNGFIYLNGHFLGRWWEVGPQDNFFLPECWLNRGGGADNVVTLCLRPTTGPTAIRAASVGPYADFAESR
jgi:hypothetical protein